MASEIGYFALLLALLVSLIQLVMPFVARRRRGPVLAVSIDKAPLVQFVFMTVAVGSFTYVMAENRDLRPAPATASTTLFDRDSSSTANLVAGLQAFASEEIGPQTPHADLPPVDEMIRRLAARLAQNPNDVEGWRTLGWSYLNTGRLVEASEAYAKAIELAPGDAEIRSARIEALVGSADGIVTAEARDAIEATLKIDPKNNRARFFKGLAKEQDGEKAAALTDWREVLRDADPNEPWVSDLKSRISELEQGLGRDSAAPRSEPQPDMASASSQAPVQPEASLSTGTGPSARDVQAADSMTPTDRAAMIKGMVDRLASRLEKSPHDADGWIKLIQSRIVLGETELAKQALARGIEAFSDDARQRDRIVAAGEKIESTR